MAISRRPLAAASGSYAFENTDSGANPVSVAVEAVDIYSIVVDNRKNSSKVFTKLFDVNFDDVEVGVSAPDMVIPTVGGKMTSLAFVNGLAFSTALVEATVRSASLLSRRSPHRDVGVKIVYVDASGYGEGMYGMGEYGP